MRYSNFSAGEVHLQYGLVTMPGDPFSINDVRHDLLFVTMRDYSMDGFMALCQLKEISRRSGRGVEVTYPYFPYSRQDRVMGDAPFSLKTFCEMVNLQGFAGVATYDPHSDVTPALLNNCVVVPQHEIIRSVVPREDGWWSGGRDVVFVSPDAGSYKKVREISDNVAIGVKHRDNTSTGKITSTNVFYDGMYMAKQFLIVDDICDGGRTFIELAKVLKKRGAARIGLYVTHGIFSKGCDELREHIDVIYTTNSFNTPIDSSLVKRKELF